MNVAENPSTWRDFYNLGYSIMGIVPNDNSLDMQYTIVVQRTQTVILQRRHFVGFQTISSILV